MLFRSSGHGHGVHSIGYSGIFTTVYAASPSNSACGGRVGMGVGALRRPNAYAISGTSSFSTMGVSRVMLDTTVRQSQIYVQARPGRAIVPN